MCLCLEATFYTVKYQFVHLADGAAFVIWLTANLMIVLDWEQASCARLCVLYESLARQACVVYPGILCCDCPAMVMHRVELVAMLTCGV